MGVGGSYARTGTPQAASSATYNVNNQLTQWKGASLTYDANGNLTSDGTNTYTWNARNQLVSISGGASASFQYDPFGRRVSKTIVGMTQYLYDGANPIQEISGTTASANLLTGGVDEYFQRTDSAGARSFLTDALGSTLALADSTGALQTQYTFEPFGNASVTCTSTTNSFAFTGRELDPTGLYFYRARYYNPQMQRFISEDPARMGGGMNFYAYVDNNPVSGTDPQGLWNTYTHGALYWNALKPCGVDNKTIYRIQQESETLDESTQAPWQAYIHSMKAPWQSPEDALNERDQWISSNLTAARTVMNQGQSTVSTVLWEDLFADALHTITDSTSPAHMQNGVPISWPSWSNVPQHGDFPGSIETWDNMTPELMQQNILAIQDAWRKLTGRKDACQQ
jgi:RHS repeat-associated protein